MLYMQLWRIRKPNFKHKKQKEKVVYVAMENSMEQLSTRPPFFGEIHLEDKTLCGYKTLSGNFCDPSR